MQRSGAMEQVGKTLVIVGLSVAALGALVWALGRVFPGLHPGRLPGDVVVERPGFTLYVPIVTMIVVSAVLTLVGWLLGALRK